MRTSILPKLLILAALLPLTAAAQKNVIDAFNAIKTCKNAKIEEQHFLQRDPYTGIKIGQCDVYTFTLPKKKIGLINDVMRAFSDDSDMAYDIGSGEKSYNTRDVVLAVGDGTGNNTVLTYPDCRYAYACFLAPKNEAPDGNYRYAYGISYDTFDSEIFGKLVVTYATTMKQRQEKSGLNPLRELNRAETWAFNKGNDNSTEPWFRMFMRYITAYGYSTSNTRPTNAGYIYEVCSYIGRYNNVSDQDKKTARGILTTLINDKSNNDPVVQQILRGALDYIKQ